MFDEAMAKAVETAQKRLMNTAESGSILMSVSSDMTALNKLVAKLDPSRIDFDKGGIHRLGAIMYWSKYEELYPELKDLFDKLGKSKNILHNSIRTVKKLQDDYMKVYDDFKAHSADEQDKDYMQQAIVSENMSMLLQTTVSEHEAVYDHLTKVLSILEESMGMAIFFAKQKFNRSVDGGKAMNSLFNSNVTNILFQRQYRQFHDVLLTN